MTRGGHQGATKPRLLPLAAWPEPDGAAWNAAHRRGGLLDDDGLATNWAPATSANIAYGYGRFLSFLAEAEGLDFTETPQDRVTRARVLAYVTHLQTLNHSSTVAARVRELGRAVAVMAPSTDWAWLRRIVARLSRSATPARDDRARLLPATTMFDLASRLMQRAEAELGLGLHQRAVLFRNGLMIAMLCVWAPRVRNIAETMIGSNFQRRAETWWADFTPHETKNKRPIEIPLPEGLTGSIDRYLEFYRPELVSRSCPPLASNALWIGWGGGPLTARGVSCTIRKVTKRELGRSINPHLFRKIIPTELAIRDPEHVGVAQPMLGHADYRTTEGAYNLGRALDAARRCHDLVRSVRGEIGLTLQSTAGRSAGRRRPDAKLVLRSGRAKPSNESKR
jgi:integrase